MVKSLLLWAVASRCSHVALRPGMLLLTTVCGGLKLQSHYRDNQFVLAFVLHCLPETHLPAEV